MIDRIGQQFGNYRLVQLLGKGGFAQVYLGEHLRLGTQAAIKVLSTYLTDKDEARFLTEARTIARLEHPHIIRILDFDVEEGIPFLVMSYATNGTLRHRYPRGTPLPLETILVYLKQVADALQYAHDEKLIHRDIKPENMLLGRRNELLLSDFGIAVVAQSSRAQNTQEIVGTVSYMAPEQIQGKPRLASDQYALAVVLYEWLCGSLPFRGTHTEVAIQHLHASPPALHGKIATTLPAVEAVVLKALAKDPHERFASIQEFAAVFEQACQGYLQTTPIILSSQLSQTAPPVHPTEHISHSATPTQPVSKSHQPGFSLSRRALLFGSLGLVGLAGAGAGAGITWLALTSMSQAAKPPATMSQAGSTLVVYKGHRGAVEAVAWSPDGKRIASAGDLSDRTVQVWDATTGNHPLIYRRHATNINSIAWSPDSKRIASASGNSLFGGEHIVQVWDATTGNLILSYPGHSGPVRCVSWSPDGKRIASGSEDKTVQIWDATTGNLILSYSKHQGHVYALTWSPDGKRIASSSEDKTVQIWDATTDNLIFTLNHASQVNTVAWSPDGTRIASGTGNAFFGDDHLVQIWDAAKGYHLFSYTGHTSAVNAVVWSHQSQRIVSASNDKTVQIWYAGSGKGSFIYHDHTLGVNSIAWSPGGTLLASASNDGTVRVWHVPA